MEQYYGWGLPINVSADGASIDNLIYIFHGFMAVLFVGWLTFLIIALIRFRQRPGHKAEYKTDHFKTPTYAEIGVAIFEVFLLFAFAFPLFNQYRNVFPPKDQSLEMRVVAEQYAWNIHYPGKDGVFGKTEPEFMGPTNPVGLDENDKAAIDDIVTINQMHVPINKPVIVHLSSKDVIHSFAIPVMRVKQDVIPGQAISVHFEAVKTGKFEIACAQLCGLGHYRMRGFFTVDTPEDFDAWLEEQEKAKETI